MPVCLANTATVKHTVAHLGTAGFDVSGVKIKDGLVTVKDGEIVVYRAIQKGRGGPWIVRCTDSENVKWSQPLEEANRAAGR